MKKSRLASIRQRDFEFQFVPKNHPGLNQAGNDRRWLIKELEKALEKIKELEASREEKCTSNYLQNSPDTFVENAIKLLDTTS